ncbi:MAG: winged helix-turn-helix domain-containing protein [Candidatus Thermoplasmatota archaeon]|nr:winged helix-turn-helix domain-containing protein [Candidatus Thermoplasmatota archaeon]
MVRRDLLESEKRVLCGIVQDPLFSDRELSKKLGMKKTTVTAIRRRLQQEDYFRSVQVPSFEKLGFEMLVVAFGTLSSVPPFDEKIALARPVVESPEFIYALLEPRQDLLIQVSRDYTSAMANIQALEEKYRERGYMEGGYQVVVFPFDLSDVLNLFDFYPLLSRMFWSEKGRPHHEPVLGQMRSTRLRAKEKETLKAIVENPELSDVQLSESLGISRMTIGKARRRFADEGLIIPRKMPNLGNLGIELLVLTHGSFHPRLEEGLKYYVPSLLETAGTTIFSILNKNKALGISAFSSYHEYKKQTDIFAEAYREQEVFSRPPTRVIFSLTGAHLLKDHEYGPLVNSAFGPELRL